MPVTVKVNGVCNSLVHKGSNHVSVATIPDVCKTPSPGGPVPVPYPNISQSITLAKGTTTVKADHGMMIAVKGSEFSLSNGDEAGVAGGVKSSTFIKESTWILYSFDVKMNGNGACRLTDKKFQNHENTVDLGGATGVPVAPTDGGDNPLVIDCKGAPHKPGSKKYTKCEIEEICAKCASVNEQAQAGKLRRRDSTYNETREIGDAKCDSLKGFAKRGSASHEDLGGFDHLSPGCAKYLKGKAANASPPYTGFSPDHVQEIQLGGHPTNHSNLRWMSSAPNSWIGSKLSGFETSGPDKHTGVKPDCCD